jgi:hypothetical protein
VPFLDLFLKWGFSKQVKSDTDLDRFLTKVAKNVKKRPKRATSFSGKLGETGLQLMDDGETVFLGFGPKTGDL